MIKEPRVSVEETVLSLFQPDTMLPVQYFEAFRRSVPIEPEKRLMFAVLEDGIACFREHVLARNGKGKGVFCEAEDWVLKGEGDRLFSFENVCEYLGLNPDYLRRGLVRWKEEKLAKRPAAKIYRLSSRIGRRRTHDASGC